MFPAQHFPRAYFPGAHFPSGVAVGPWVYPYGAIGPSIADAAPAPTAKAYTFAVAGRLVGVSGSCKGVEFVHGPYVVETEGERQGMSGTGGASFVSGAAHVRAHEQNMLAWYGEPRLGPKGTALKAPRLKIKYDREGLISRVLHCDESGNVLLTQDVRARDAAGWASIVVETRTNIARGAWKYSGGEIHVH